MEENGTPKAEHAVADQPRGALSAVRGLDEGLGTGLVALAGLSDAEFQRRMDLFALGLQRVEKIKATLMQPGVDFGYVQKGETARPSLWQPGGQLLTTIYGLVADFKPEKERWRDGDLDRLSVFSRCEIHLGSLAGPTVAIGYGAATSMEVKHRWRAQGFKCSECGKSAAMFKSKKPGEGWYCWRAKDGCGAQFREDNPDYQGAPPRVENTEIGDLENTLVKQANKRAFIAGVVMATNSSRMFTQPDGDGGGEAKRAEVKTSDKMPLTDGQRVALSTLASGRAKELGLSEADSPGILSDALTFVGMKSVKEMTHSDIPRLTKAIVRWAPSGRFA